jgi:hypothetical protein
LIGTEKSSEKIVFQIRRLKQRENNEAIGNGFLFLIVGALLVPASADNKIPIFDAHLHYNQAAALLHTRQSVGGFQAE